MLLDAIRSRGAVYLNVSQVKRSLVSSSPPTSPPPAARISFPLPRRPAGSLRRSRVTSGQSWHKNYVQLCCGSPRRCGWRRCSVPAMPATCQRWRCRGTARSQAGCGIQVRVPGVPDELKIFWRTRSWGYKQEKDSRLVPAQLAQPAGRPANKMKALCHKPRCARHGPGVRLAPLQAASPKSSGSWILHRRG